MEVHGGWGRYTELKSCSNDGSVTARLSLGLPFSDASEFVRTISQHCSMRATPYTGRQSIRSRSCGQARDKNPQYVALHQREVIPVKHHSLPPVESPSCLSYHDIDLVGVVFDLCARVASTQN